MYPRNRPLRTLALLETAEETGDARTHARRAQAALAESEAQARALRQEREKREAEAAAEGDRLVAAIRVAEQRIGAEFARMLGVARQAGFMVVDTDAWKAVTAPDGRQVLALKAAPRTIPELCQARGWLIGGGVPLPAPAAS
jgi:hypothetical protein